MPGRIESYEPVLGAALVLPYWKIKLNALRKKAKRDKPGA